MTIITFFRFPRNSKKKINRKSLGGYCVNQLFLTTTPEFMQNRPLSLHQTTTMANTGQFPREIIVDILIRLGVKDLLRYRCVSKPWCSLIDGPDFIKLHLHHSLKTSSNAGLILHCGRDFCWVDLDGALDSGSRLSVPIHHGGNVPILGCCDGLLVVANSHGDVALWNPSTRKHAQISLPDVDKTSISLGVFESEIVGFGHDPVTDDYKVLRRKLVVDENHRLRCDPMLFSVENNTWKRVSGLPYYYGSYRDNHALVHNSLHWIFNRNYECGHYVPQVIGAFDLVTEKYREVSFLPNFDEQGQPFLVKLVEFGGCLCLVCSYSSEVSFSFSMKLYRSDIWVMKEYGVEESWTKLFSVEPTRETGAFGHVEPVAYLKGSGGGGCQVLLNMDCQRLVVYDLESKRGRVLRISGALVHFRTRVCVESLVGVGTGGGGSGGGGDGESSTSTVSDGKQESLENKNKGKKEKRQPPSGKKRDDFLSMGFKLVL